MSALPVSLSIVVPAFSEEARIGRSLDALLDWSADRDDPVEILVVDDGSSDGTADVVERYADRGVRLIRLPTNRGKGAALRAGVAASCGRRVLLTDADLSTPISELARLEAALDSADIAIGSRALAASRITERQPLWRQSAGKLFNGAIRLLGVRGFQDTQCGFKLLDGEVARDLFGSMSVDRFAYDVELIWLAVRRGLRVVEVGVEWRNDRASTVSLFRDGSRMLYDVYRLRRRFAREDRRRRSRPA